MWSWCRRGAVSVLGNGDPLYMDRYEMPVSKTAAPKHKPFSVSHRAHLEPTFHKKYTKISNDFQVVLFHYVTRSQNSFVERKINRRSGVYATTYSELKAKDSRAGNLLLSYPSSVDKVWSDQMCRPENTPDSGLRSFCMRMWVATVGSLDVSWAYPFLLSMSL